MTTPRRPRAARLLAFALPALLALTALPAARAQDSGDDALEKLLDKVDPPADTPKPPADRPKADDVKKPAAGAKPQTDQPKADKPAPKPADPEDKALDSLLEKLGQTDDEPEAKDERPQGPGGPPGEQPPTPPGGDPSGQPPRDTIRPEQQGLDEHLEELTGVRRKKKDGEQEDPQQGQMAQAIKKMREVEKRLQEDDTGEQTRGRQKEIVKDLDQMIQQAKNSSRPGSGRPGSKPGPGDKPGEQPGKDGSGVGASAPKKPTAKSVLAENKDEWGHLPPELRAEMENVFREDALPNRKGLIDRYYISVTRKSAGASSDRGD